MNRMYKLKLSQVEVLDAYYKNAAVLENTYLLSLDPDRLLAGFRETAGVDTKGKERYGGWENMLIGGHTLGHYLTALAQAYVSAHTPVADREKLLDTLEYVVASLKECQETLGSGFLFGATIPDKDNIFLQFDLTEEGRPLDIIKEAWVPWYTMHKIVAGLVSCALVYEDRRAGQAEDSCEREKAFSHLSLSVVSSLADWCYDRVASWDEETRLKVLRTEYGGMNDCLYDVYLLTNKEEHLKAAMAFDEIALYERVLAGQDGENVLTNVHANTTIPKFIGCMKHFLVTREEKYLDYVVAFWNMVNINHTYVTGGNSQWEHFRVDGALNADRTNCNCETCNSYNMLKLTSYLYMETGDLRYADWYENTMINSILPSQNPGTGMTTYFQPMATGYFKTFSNEFHKFWCCTGSGMENFSKLGTDIYYAAEDMLIVSRYVSSKVFFGGNEFTLTADVPASDLVLFEAKEDYKGKVAFRIPGWAKGASVKADGHKVTVTENLPGLSVTMAKEPRNDDSRVMSTEADNYIVIEDGLKAGEVITVILPASVKAFGLPDSKNTCAIKYGPVVLAGLLGSEEMKTTMTGVCVTIPEEPVIDKEYIPSGSDEIKVTSGSSAEFLAHTENYFERSGKSVRFTLKGCDSSLTFVPHYSQHTGRYGLYFTYED